MGTIQLQFEDVNQAEANLHAQALMQHLKEAAPSGAVTIERLRDDPQAMDAGSTIAITVIVVATKFLIEVTGKTLAEVVKDYISKKFPAKVRLTLGEQSVVIDPATPISELQRYFGQLGQSDAGGMR